MENGQTDELRLNFLVSLMNRRPPCISVPIQELEGGARSDPEMCLPTLNYVNHQAAGVVVYSKLTHRLTPVSLKNRAWFQIVKHVN